MLKLKKLLSAFLVSAVIFGSLSANAAVFGLGNASAPISSGYSRGTTSGRDFLGKIIDISAFRSYLFEYLYSGYVRIDVSSFGIPYTSDYVQAVADFVWLEMPEAFHVKDITTDGENNYLTILVVSYYYPLDEYHAMYAEMQNAANRLLDGISDNPLLTELDKALLLHDRLIVWNEYDNAAYLAGTISRESYTAYGALVKRISVCQGYTLAYMYLLDQVGIKNIYCMSAELNHAWNIVYISGIPYYVDVTWDDQVWDVSGQVYHNNFLVSHDLFYQQGHTSNDYNILPQNNYFDNWYWRNSMAEIQLIDGALYYIDNVSLTLNRLKDNMITRLISVDDVWKAPGGMMWLSNFARLSSDGKDLFFSLSDAVFEFDVTNQVTKVICRPDISVGNSFGIYGFTYEDGYLICDLNNSPNFSEDTKRSYQVKYLYDKLSPTAQIVPNNEPASSRLVTFNFADNAGISGYYWGKSDNFLDNDYFVTDKLSASGVVMDSGTYYLTARDIAGNVSQTQAITFYKITLNAGNGSVDSQYIITTDNELLVFPTAVRGGYYCKGWATSPNAAENAVTKIRPSSDAVYYAIWEKLPGDVNGDSRINSKDLARLMKFIAGEPVELLGDADLNGDGRINSKDLTRMMKTIAGA